MTRRTAAPRGTPDAPRRRPSQRVARIKTLKKLREFQKQKYSIVTQFAW